MSMKQCNNYLKHLPLFSQCPAVATVSFDADQLVVFEGREGTLTVTVVGTLARSVYVNFEIAIAASNTFQEEGDHLLT